MVWELIGIIELIYQEQSAVDVSVGTALYDVESRDLVEAYYSINCLTGDFELRSINDERVSYQFSFVQASKTEQDLAVAACAALTDYIMEEASYDDSSQD